MKLMRKIVHIIIGIAVLIVLMFYHTDTKEYLVIILSSISLIGLIVDLLRMVFHKFNYLLTEKLLPFLFTSNEADGINSATFFFFSAALCTLLFERNIAITSIAILTFADSMASIIGTHFGKRKVGIKTLEGTITFFTIALIICLLYFPLWKSIIVALILSIVELTSVKIDDNLAIPIITGFILTLIGN